MDAIEAVVKTFFCLIILILAAVIGPPVIALWTLFDKSKPFWKVFWKRYLDVLLAVLYAAV